MTTTVDYEGPQLAFGNAEQEQDAPPPESAPLRERVTFYVGQLAKHFQQVQHALLDPKSLDAFYNLVTIIAEASKDDFADDDIAALRTFDALAGHLCLVMDRQPLKDWRTWTGVPQSECPQKQLRAQFVNESQSFAKPPREPVPVRRRETVEQLEEQGVSDQQICKIYNWRTIHGAGDLAKLKAYREGKYQLSEDEKFIHPPQRKVSFPRLAFVKELLTRLRERGDIE